MQVFLYKSLGVTEAGPDDTENLGPTGVRPLDRPVRSRSLYRSSCKGKYLPQQAEAAQGVPDRLRPRIFLTFGTTRVVGRQPYAPLPQEKSLVLIFRG